MSRRVSIFAFALRMELVTGSVAALDSEDPSP
jgi:hypothetical protein